MSEEWTKYVGRKRFWSSPLNLVATEQRCSCRILPENVEDFAYYQVDIHCDLDLVQYRIVIVWALRKWVKSERNMWEEKDFATEWPVRSNRHNDRHETGHFHHRFYDQTQSWYTPWPFTWNLSCLSGVDSKEDKYRKSFIKEQRRKWCHYWRSQDRWFHFVFTGGLDHWIHVAPWFSRKKIRPKLVS